MGFILQIVVYVVFALMIGDLNMYVSLLSGILNCLVAVDLNLVLNIKVQYRYIEQ